MMPAFIDLTGQRFGRWTAIKYLGHLKWLCLCDCGKEGTPKSQSLRNGRSTSCGCFHAEVIKMIRFKHGQSNRNKTLTYTSWATMIQRCTNTKHKNYHLYGGRGVSICDRWRTSFEAFLEDMGERPSKKHSLDRIDVNGYYEPSNCKWSTQSEQIRNRRTSPTNGTSWDKVNNKWKASINVNGKTVNLGRYVYLEDALKARKEAEIKYWGKSS